MKHLPLAVLCFLSQPLLRAEEAPLDKTVSLAGGFSRYQRAETLSYDFEDFVAGSTVPVRAGRRRMRLHDGGGLRAREDVAAPDGSWTVVVTSSGAWAAKDGSPVADPSALAALAGGLRREVFLDLLPHVVKEEGRPLNPLPSAFFLGRLMNRAAVDGPPLFPGGEGLVLVLSRGEGRLEGLTHGAPATHVLFTQFEENKSLLVFPARRAVYGTDEKRLSSTVRRNIVVNDFVDESLFIEGARP